MKREMEPYQLIERSIIKKYRKELWTPFIVAVIFGETFSTVSDHC